MRAIARKDRKRKTEDPLKATTYRLRKRMVPPQRIERYKRDHHITDETAISEAGMLKRITSLAFANGNIGLATPSDLSCETPRSLVLSDSPIHAPPPAPYEPLTSSFRTSCVHCEAWIAGIAGIHDYLYVFDPKILSNPSSEAPSSGPQLYHQMSNANLSLSVPSLASHAHPHSNAYCLPPTYVKLLQSLVSKLGKYVFSTNTNESLAVFNQHSIDYYLRFLRDPGQRYTSCGRLPTPEAGQNLVPSSHWMFHRLEDRLIQAVFESKGIYMGIARIHQFLTEFCIARTAMSSFVYTVEAFALPPFQTLVDTADSYKLALGDRACGCHVCGLLPQLLTFETFIEAFQLDALSPARMTSTIDSQYWFRRVREMTQAWLRAPDNVLVSHSFCHLSVARATVTLDERAVASMTSHEDDENLLVALSRLQKHLRPLCLETGEMENSL